MATKIKLQRLGKMREPHYRIVVADARTQRDGRYIEAIGQYHPKDDPSRITVDAERAAYWLSVGAQPTETVMRLLAVTGDWQKHKGLPAPEPMRFAPAKAVKAEVFAEAAKAAATADDRPATTAPSKRKAPAKKVDETSVVEAPAAADAPAEPTDVARAAAEAPDAAEPAAAEAPAAAEPAAAEPGETESAD